MTYVSNSTLSWLDSSEQERRSVLELVSALSEPGTLDELGIGRIRDTISEALFPGTSTIQTRARYFLFIPWIFQMVERASGSNPSARARELQLTLCNALDRAHGPNQGVIGRESGAALRRWPDSIYWPGLERWGIRLYRGSVPSYYAALRRPPSWMLSGGAPDEPGEDGSHETAERARSYWAPMPERPEDFPDAATFELTPDEAEFLRDRVSFTHSSCFLAYLLQAEGGDGPQDVAFPWKHPAALTAPPAARDWLRDARLFSLVHRGAAILYNLMLAQASVDSDRADMFTERLATWADEINGSLADIMSWDRDAMWRRLETANPRIRGSTHLFVDRWYALVTTGPLTSLPENRTARDLIRDRERTLKHTRARLSYEDARSARSGYPTSTRLDFRWPQAKTIANDILECLGG